MSRIAVIGNVARDRVDDGPPTPGGCPSFAALALRMLDREGQIVTRFAPRDRELFAPLLAGLGVPVEVLPARTTSGFGLLYEGRRRTMTVDAIGDEWSPDDVAAVAADAGWVHVAPLLRSDFPAATLAALAAPGRRVSLDGQGLVRVPRVGPLAVDADFDPALLEPLAVLKLAEDEAAVLARGRFGAEDAARLGVPEVLLTLGEEGCVVFAGGPPTWVPAAWPVLGVQTTGAGDVFMVGYVAARSDGRPPAAAAAEASELVARMLEERKRGGQGASAAVPGAAASSLRDTVSRAGGAARAAVRRARGRSELSQPRIERPRGTHDVVPAEMPQWRRVTEEVERLCALYGYRPIATPVFEDTALFQRTSGAGSDVVQKEMYTFADRSDRSLTLRPEGTAPICRAYVEHGMHRDPQPQKLYTIAPMYRYGAPGRGRYREHWQASVEALGSDDPALDAELIQLYDTLLARLGVTRYHLELNSIGCRACRPAHLETLRRWLAANDARLDAATREKAATSPLRVFDNLAAKPEPVRAALAEAPTIGESLCAACVEHFAAVRAALDATGVAYTLVPTLVRGLDYYSRTTWEFVGPLANENATLTGGGRYDYLIEEIGGPPTPGVGFGAGIERLLIAMEEERVEAAEPPALDVFLVAGEGADRLAMRRVLKELRDAGLAADMDYAGRSLKGQLTQAGRLRARARVRFGARSALVEHPGGSGAETAFDAVAASVVAALGQNGSP